MSLPTAGRAEPVSGVRDARALLRLPVNRKVTGVLEGSYVALHPGRSTEFVDVREYVDGDDPKDIDWKASARARTLYVRRQHAHRKLTVLLAVSTGRSMAAAARGAPTRTKIGLATGVAGVVGAVGIGHGDLVGLVAGDAADRTAVRPRGGAAHLEHCLTVLRDACTPTSAASDLPALLRHVERSVRRSSLIVLVIDEVAPDAEALDLMARLRGRHELLVVAVDGADPFTLDPDEHPLVTDVDAATPLPTWLRRDAALATAHEQRIAQDRADLDRALGGLGLAHVHVTREDQIVPALARLFDRHRRAGRR